MRPVLTALLNEAMKIEREPFPGASHYEHSQDRLGFAHGYQDKRIDTQAGTLNLRIPKTAQHVDEPFYPQWARRLIQFQTGFSPKSLLVCSATRFLCNKPSISSHFATNRRIYP